MGTVEVPTVETSGNSNDSRASVRSAITAASVLERTRPDEAPRKARVLPPAPTPTALLAGRRVCARPACASSGSVAQTTGGPGLFVLTAHVP